MSADYSPLMRSDLMIGRPLPFSVFDDTKRLILAAGWVIESEDRLECVLEMGKFRDSPSGSVRTPRRQPEAKTLIIAEAQPQKMTPFPKVRLGIEAMSLVLELDGKTHSVPVQPI